MKDEDLGSVQNTCGYLIRNNRRWIVIAMDWGEKSGYRDTYEIPKKLVTRIEYLFPKEEAPVEIQ